MKNKILDIVITDAVLGDEKDIAIIHKKTWLATYPNKEHNISKRDILLKDFDSEKKINKWKEILKNNGKNNDYLCVAKDGKSVIGFCLASKEESFNELKIIYILPKYQRMKIGRKLLDRAIGWLGYGKNIAVSVVAYNENAINFYEKYGFIKTGVTSNNEFPNGKIIPEIQLILNYEK